MTDLFGIDDEGTRNRIMKIARRRVSRTGVFLRGAVVLMLLQAISFVAGVGLQWTRKSQFLVSAIVVPLVFGLYYEYLLRRLCRKQMPALLRELGMRCISCGHELCGAVSDKCPECGTSTSDSKSANTERRKGVTTGS